MITDRICEPMSELKEYIREFLLRNRSGVLTDVYSVTNSEGFVPSTDYFKKEVFSKDLTSYKVVRPGMLAYNPSRINVGSVDCLALDHDVIVSPLYVVFETDRTRLLPEYLNLFLHSSIALGQIKALTAGSVRDSLKFSALGRLQLKIPTLDQQSELLAKAKAIRDLISGREQQLDKLDQLVKSRFVEAA